METGVRGGMRKERPKLKRKGRENMMGWGRRLGRKEKCSFSKFGSC